MLSQRLKQLRADKNINQMELARDLGVNQGTVGKWETGSRKPDSEMLSRLADYFSVSIDYLLGRDEKNSDVILLARNLSNLPAEDREFLINNFNSTLDVYFKTKRINNE